MLNWSLCFCYESTTRLNMFLTWFRHNEFQIHSFHCQNNTNCIISDAAGQDKSFSSIRNVCFFLLHVMVLRQIYIHIMLQEIIKNGQDPWRIAKLKFGTLWCSENKNEMAPTVWLEWLGESSSNLIFLGVVFKRYLQDIWLGSINTFRSKLLGL